jgi:amidase
MPAVELVELTFADLEARMASGSDTAKSLVQKYRQRIEAIDRKGPTLRSVLELNPDADAIADQLDAERKAGKRRGPLHGIPILVKDNVDTGDKMTTTAGSLALEGSHAEKDSFVVARLRAAGAIILGKTNLSEWANFRGMASSSGWSGRGGQCRNPYALDRNPSGSSSGSGVAVSANLCAAAIGTETDGSIVSPSTHNGIVGLKPTLGAVSRTGVVPISHTQDTPGPMTRTVADAAAVFAAIAGRDERDAATRDLTGTFAPRSDGLRGVRSGAARNVAEFPEAVSARFEDALVALRGLGAEVSDLDVPHAGELDAPEFEVLLYEFKADLDAYLAGARGAHVRSLEEAVAFNREHADREMPFFGQDVFESALAKGPLTEPAYLEALATCGRLSRDEGLDVALAEVDVVVAPTAGPAWLTDHVNGDHYGGASSTPCAVSGYPAVTVPMGSVAGLPVGISFMGRPWSELDLLGVAEAYERETGHRVEPRFLPTIEP